MTFREDLSKTGAWLFSHRSYVPLLLIPFTAVLMLSSADFPQLFAEELPWKVLSLIVALCGMVVRSIAVGTAAPSTSGRNTGGQLAASLNTTGIYSVVRHPLYVGNFITVVGIVLWTGVWWFVLLSAVLYWFYYERIIFNEEEFLDKKFGKTFRDWAAETNAIIPKFSTYLKPQYSFSMKIVLAREYDSLLAIVTSFALLELMEYLSGKTHREYDIFWLVLFAVTFIVTAFLRYARKHTTLLQVSRR